MIAQLHHLAHKDEVSRWLRAWKALNREERPIARDCLLRPIQNLALQPLLWETEFVGASELEGCEE